MQNLKLCKSCGITKPLVDFTRNITDTNFKQNKSGIHSYCKPCNALRAKEWRKTCGVKDYRGTGRNKLVPVEDRLLMSAIRSRLADAKGRTRKFNKAPVDLTDMYLYRLYLQQDRKCALTGVTLTLEKGNPLSFSLDQIEPTKGYIEGNVQWVAWAVNRAKGDLSMRDFYGMCNAVLEYQKVQRLSKDSNAESSRVGSSEPKRIA